MMMFSKGAAAKVVKDDIVNDDGSDQFVLVPSSSSDDEITGILSVEVKEDNHDDGFVLTKHSKPTDVIVCSDDSSDTDGLDEGDISNNTTSNSFRYEDIISPTMNFHSIVMIAVVVMLFMSTLCSQCSFFQVTITPNEDKIEIQFDSSTSGGEKAKKVDNKMYSSTLDELLVKIDREVERKKRIEEIDVMISNSQVSIDWKKSNDPIEEDSTSSSVIEKQDCSISASSNDIESSIPIPTSTPGTITPPEIKPIIISSNENLEGVPSLIHDPNYPSIPTKDVTDSSSSRPIFTTTNHQQQLVTVMSSIIGSSSSIPGGAPELTVSKPMVGIMNSQPTSKPVVKAMGYSTTSNNNNNNKPTSSTTTDLTVSKPSLLTGATDPNILLEPMVKSVDHIPKNYVTRDLTSTVSSNPLDGKFTSNSMYTTVPESKPTVLQSKSLQVATNLVDYSTMIPIRSEATRTPEPVVVASSNLTFRIPVRSKDLTNPPNPAIDTTTNLTVLKPVLRKDTILSKPVLSSNVLVPRLAQTMESNIPVVAMNMTIPKPVKAIDSVSLWPVPGENIIHKPTTGLTVFNSYQGLSTMTKPVPHTNDSTTFMPSSISNVVHTPTDNSIQEIPARALIPFAVPKLSPPVPIPVAIRKRIQDNILIGSTTNVTKVVEESSEAPPAVTSGRRNKRSHIQTRLPVPLTNETFWEYVRAHENVFVAFYVDKRDNYLRSLWARLAVQAHRDKLPYSVAAIDCSVYTAFCKSPILNVNTEAPTLRWFRKGRPQRRFYDKEWSVEGFLHFAKNRLPQPTNEQNIKRKRRSKSSRVRSREETTKDNQGFTILTDKNFVEFLTNNENSFVAFSVPSPAYSSIFVPFWKKWSLDEGSTSSNSNGFQLATVDCSIYKSTICKEQNIKSYPTLRWYKKESMVEEFDGTKYFALEDFAKVMMSLSINTKDSNIKYYENTSYGPIQKRASNSLIPV